MNGRAIVTFILGLIVVGILVGAGVGIYQAGLAQGVVDAGRVPAGAVVPVAGYGYGYGWGFHGGFGFLGLLFPILFLFLIFGLIRAAFFRGRGWGPGWGGRGYWGKGYGPGYGGPGGPGGPDAWREERDRQISDLHRRLHDEEAGSGSTSSSSQGSGSGSGSSGSAR